MKRPAKSISEAELEVLKALWDVHSGTVRELSVRLKKSGRRWAYTTVQTLLNRLHVKGYVTVDASGATNVYAASVTKEKLVRRRLRWLADELLDGAASPLVMALMKAEKFSAEELESFRQLLQEKIKDEG